MERDSWAWWRNFRCGARLGRRRGDFCFRHGYRLEWRIALSSPREMDKNRQIEKFGILLVAVFSGSLNRGRISPFSPILGLTNLYLIFLLIVHFLYRESSIFIFGSLVYLIVFFLFVEVRATLFRRKLLTRQKIRWTTKKSRSGRLSRESSELARRYCEVWSIRREPLSGTMWMTGSPVTFALTSHPRETLLDWYYL